jgi:Tfp pilus assembly protein PilO
MVDQILRQVLTHPKRVWIVITISLLVAMVFTWPAVDFYLAAAQQRAQLLDDLQEGEEIAGKLQLYQTQVEKKNAQLSELEKRVLSTEELDRFREQLVEGVKSAGCKLRRIKLSDPNLRTWYDQDDPFDSRARTEKDKKSPYKLQSLQLGVQVTGPMEKIFEFLAKLSEQDRLIHTGNFVLRKSTEDNNLVEMDLDLILFDLIQGEKPQ